MRGRIALVEVVTIEHVALGIGKLSSFLHARSGYRIPRREQCRVLLIHHAVQDLELGDGAVFEIALLVLA